MKRRRELAGSPLRTGIESWRTLVDLIVRSLESSSNIAGGSVATELARLDGVGAALASGGFLEAHRPVLVASPLWVEFTITTGEAAFDVDEDLAIIPGSANADGQWQLFLPDVPALSSAIVAASANCPHVAIGVAPEPVEEASSTNGLDVAALLRRERGE